MKYRELKKAEADILKDFLYEAIFIPEGVTPPDKSIVENPELKIYYEDFGRKEADFCIVAESKGKIVGATWSRIRDDYGHVDDHTPSLSISLYPSYRSKGHGRVLMKKLMDKLKEKGYKKVSLSVQKENYAFKFYESLGFKVIQENIDDCIMVCEL